MRSTAGTPSEGAAAALGAILEEPLRACAWPGGVLAVAGARRETILIPHGYHTYERLRPVRASDWFDLASLTKVVATTTAAMLAVERGLIDLQAPLAGLLPEFAASVPEDAARRARVTLTHLLTHTSGLPAHIAFYREPQGSAEQSFARVCRTPLQAEPGAASVYSDIGMMLLGFALDRAFGRPWHGVVREAVFLPLGMRHTRFRPPPHVRVRVLPTECTGEGGAPWQGIVHDENARWLGGIAGHAGLFSTAGDLCRFARMLLRKGTDEGGGAVLRAETIERFTRRAGVVAGSSRCLGWDSPSGASSGGDHLSAESFGHTGFTGTSLWVDPAADVAVVLLTNAVHPRRECRTERGFFEWRRRVHSAVYEVLGLARGRGDGAHSGGPVPDPGAPGR